jgi:hypothetical protein
LATRDSIKPFSLAGFRRKLWYDGLNIKDWIKRHGKTQELAWCIAQAPSEEKAQIAKAKIIK